MRGVLAALVWHVVTYVAVLLLDLVEATALAVHSEAVHVLIILIDGLADDAHSLILCLLQYVLHILEALLHAATLLGIKVLRVIEFSVLGVPLI